MTIVLIGLNHRTAPVELREQLTLIGNDAQSAYNGLKYPGSPVQEAVILSTCNRLEIYAVVSHQNDGWRTIESLLVDRHDIQPETLRPHLYYLEGTAAVQHLMRVACGLDSMILGESQILGQVTQAFNIAQNNHLTGPVLSNLLSQSIHAGKRARTETVIGRFTTSVSHAGALMVLDKVEVPQANILVVGAGEMAILAAKALHKHEAVNLAFINRTYRRAESIAAELGGKALGWHQLQDALIWADAVITATGAPHTVLYANDIEQAQQKRAGRSLLFVDIAVPRDVEVAVGDVFGVERFDIDDLQSIVDSNTAQRKAAIPQVEKIIKREIERFFEWYHSREVTPIIKDLRRWATEVAQDEVNQALNKLGNVDDQTSKVVNRLAHRLVNKLLHEPTVRLRGRAVEGNGYGYAHAISELFGLGILDCDNEEPICHDIHTQAKANPLDTQATPCNLQCISPSIQGRRNS